MPDWDRIIADLHEIDDSDRAIAACRALEAAADDTRLPDLHGLLAEGRDFFVREAAANPIARLEGLRALPQLLHALHLGRKEGHDCDGLASLVADLVQADVLRAAPMLQQMIVDPSEQRREDAAWLWGFARTVLAPDPLLSALRDSCPDVRGAAAGSLSSFKDHEGVLEGLAGALEDADDQVRVDAASALGYLGDDRALPSLVRALCDPIARVRVFAGNALKQLKGRAS